MFDDTCFKILLLKTLTGSSSFVVVNSVEVAWPCRFLSLSFGESEDIADEVQMRGRKAIHTAISRYLIFDEVW